MLAFLRSLSAARAAAHESHFAIDAGHEYDVRVLRAGALDAAVLRGTAAALSDLAIDFVDRAAPARRAAGAAGPLIALFAELAAKRSGAGAGGRARRRRRPPGSCATSSRRPSRPRCSPPGGVPAGARLVGAAAVPPPIQDRGGKEDEDRRHAEEASTCKQDTERRLALRGTRPCSRRGRPARRDPRPGGRMSACAAPGQAPQPRRDSRAGRLVGVVAGAALSTRRRARAARPVRWPAVLRRRQRRVRRARRVERPRGRPAGPSRKLARVREVAVGAQPGVDQGPRRRGIAPGHDARVRLDGVPEARATARSARARAPRAAAAPSTGTNATTGPSLTAHAASSRLEHTYVSASINNATSKCCSAVATARILAARSRLKAKFAGSRRFRQRSAVESDDRSATGRSPRTPPRATRPRPPPLCQMDARLAAAACTPSESSVTSIASRPSKRLLEHGRARAPSAATASPRRSRPSPRGRGSRAPSVARR